MHINLREENSLCFTVLSPEKKLLSFYFLSSKNIPATIKSSAFFFCDMLIELSCYGSRISSAKLKLKNILKFQSGLIETLSFYLRYPTLGPSCPFS